MTSYWIMAGIGLLIFLLKDRILPRKTPEQKIIEAMDAFEKHQVKQERIDNIIRKLKG